MQTSVSETMAVAAYPGQLADSAPHKIVTALNLRTPAKLITPTAANSTAYELTFEQGTTDVTVGYTSDSTATSAEIVAGLLAATPSGTIKDWDLVAYGALLAAVAKPGVASPRAVTSTGAGTLTLSTLDATIPFGAVVAINTLHTLSAGSPFEVFLPKASTNKILGIALSTHFIENRYPADSNAASYGPGCALNVLRKGVVWLKPDEAVVAGGAVYFRVDGSGAVGTADGGSDGLLSGAVWLDTVSSGNFARCEINLPA